EEDDGLSSETLSRLMEALVQLPPRERRGGALGHFEGVPSGGIAAELGGGEENARPVVHPGRQRRRRLLSVAASPGGVGPAAGVRGVLMRAGQGQPACSTPRVE